MTETVGLLALALVALAGGGVVWWCVDRRSEAAWRAAPPRGPVPELFPLRPSRAPYGLGDAIFRAQGPCATTRGCRCRRYDGQSIAAGAPPPPLHADCPCILEVQT